MAEWMTPNGISAIASLVAAIAALYGVVQGFATYRDSLHVRKLTALTELERGFERTIPFFEQLEDSGTYEVAVRPVLERERADRNRRKSETQPRALEPAALQVLTDLDRAVRFFYIFWVRAGVLKDSDGLLAVYAPYLEPLRKLTEVRSYVDHYYPNLITNLDKILARRPQISE